MAGDVFHERLHRVLKSVPSTTGIVGYVSCAMATQKSSMMQLCLPCWRQQELIISLSMQTSLSLSVKTVCFFGGNLTLHGYKIDPQKVQSITEVKASQNLQDLQSYLGLMNYLNRFSPKLADLTILGNGGCKTSVHLAIVSILPG